jgi:predicted ATPase
MPHLLRLALKHPPPDDAPYPFSVPQIRMLPEVDVNVPVTFFVGENGSGKSTLLEGIAAAAELPAMGASQVATDDTLAPARQLGVALRLVWTARSRKGFFLRAEDFFGRLKWLARDDARDLREKTEAAMGVRADVPRAVSFTASHPDEGQARKFLPQYDNRSHGESFMDLFATRVRPGGLYLLDEPEAPLSPKRQLAFLDLLMRTSKTGAQFIIATHSPILLGCPEARIYSFDQTPIAPVAYESLEHVTLTRDFLNHRDRFVGGLLDDERVR